MIDVNEVERAVAALNDAVAWLDRVLHPVSLVDAVNGPEAEIAALAPAPATPEPPKVVPKVVGFENGGPLPSPTPRATLHGGLPRTGFGAPGPWDDPE